MDPPEHFSAGDKPSSGRRSELQGPRPTALKVNKDSYKISKPPVAPQLPHHHYHRYLQPPPPAAPPHTGATTTAAAQTQNSQPVIIYAVSPKVIHTTVSDFMDLVQRLTGSTNTSSSSSATGETHTAAAAAATAGDISPAARLASIERASPSERERAAVNAATTAAPVFDESANEFLRILDETNVQVGQSNIPSILSPAPATLPPVSPPGLFSPTVDPFMQISNMFIPSPSTLFSAPIASPSSSSRDLFIQLFDF